MRGGQAGQAEATKVAALVLEKKTTTSQIFNYYRIRKSFAFLNTGCWENIARSLFSLYLRQRHDLR